MKSLDEKAAEYSARLSNQTGNYTKGEIETAYVIGATENAELISGESGTFGQAIATMQRGNLVTRKGWNGKGVFIFMRPADELHISFVAQEIKSSSESEGLLLSGLCR